VKPKYNRKRIRLFSGIEAEFPIFKVPPMPKISLGKELAGKLVITPEVKRSWFKLHGSGPNISALPISVRARDYFWRAAILAPKDKLASDTYEGIKILRDQLALDFGKAMDDGLLKEFVISFATALGKRVTRVGVQNPMSDFLIAYWIHPDVPLCCFTHVALADYLAEVFKRQKHMTPKAIGRRCERLKLLQVPRPPVTDVIPAVGAILLRG
jgi:hypothetical protein